MKTDIVIIDDNIVLLRHLAEHLKPLTEVSCGGEVVTTDYHSIQPVMLKDDEGRIDLNATLKKVKRLKPGVAVIDLRLEGDDADDYSGVALARKIKGAFADCCIILVSSSFGESRKLLDDLELFRFRVDRSQSAEVFGAELRERVSQALKTHTTALSFQSLIETQSAPARRDRRLASRRVYISYAWSDENEPKPGREEIVNQIEASLRANGYEVWQDKTRLRYKDPVRAFMRQLGRGRCVVVVASDKYLRSPYCMYELLEIFVNHRFHERVCPVVLPDARLSSRKDRINYVAYWINEYKAVRRLENKVDLSARSVLGLSESLKYRDISEHAEELLEFLANMKHLPTELLAQDDFAVLRAAIDHALG